MTGLLVLHRLSDERRGAPWRATLETGAWDGPWDAADLPDQDYYDRADLVMVALARLRSLGWSQPPVVVAVGSQFAVAELLALGGRAAAIALVDAPAVLDVSPDEEQRLQYEWLRRYGDDPGPHHDLAPFCDAAFAARQRAAITVPVVEMADTSPAGVLATVRAWWGDVQR